jgi:hypothetical protein
MTDHPTTKQEVANRIGDTAERIAEALDPVIEESGNIRVFVNALGMFAGKAVAFGPPDKVDELRQDFLTFFNLSSRRPS